jgi:copper chaperone CopZ
MKNINKVIIAITLIFLAAGNASAQKKQELAEAKILTSAICSMCKTTLEKGLAFEKGIKRSELDVESKIITVYYNPEKTNLEKIRKAINKLGYDADDKAADPKAYEKLDGCCKKGAVCNDK